MKDPDFVQAYNVVQPQMDAIRAMFDVKTPQNPNPENKDLEIEK